MGDFSKFRGKGWGLGAQKSIDFDFLNSFAGRKKKKKKKAPAGRTELSHGKMKATNDLEVD